MKHIDPHVHCRDGKEAYKTTIREVSEIAKKQGIVAIFDMPNTDPPILTEKDVLERLKLAEERNLTRRRGYPEYFLYIGLTADEKQIKEAVKVAANHPRVVGLKLYTAGPAHGLEVTRETDQGKIYWLLADLDYRGVLAVHCEKVSEFKPELWDPQRPWAHANARPLRAQLASINDQIIFAKEAKFKGKLHICHVPCADGVDLIWIAKKDLQITCGVTPHHILFSQEDMVEWKFLLKVNPPLYNLKEQQKLRNRLWEGRIDWIETDHAPHTWEEKVNFPYLSGVTSLCLYHGFLVWLNQQGLSWSEIEKLTYWNIKRIFGEKLKGV